MLIIGWRHAFPDAFWTEWPFIIISSSLFLPSVVIFTVLIIVLPSVTHCSLVNAILRNPMTIDGYTLRQIVQQNI